MWLLIHRTGSHILTANSCSGLGRLCRSAGEWAGKAERVKTESSRMQRSKEEVDRKEGPQELSSLDSKVGLTVVW